MYSYIHTFYTKLVSYLFFTPSTPYFQNSHLIQYPGIIWTLTVASALTCYIGVSLLRALPTAVAPDRWDTLHTAGLATAAPTQHDKLLNKVVKLIHVDSIELLSEHWTFLEVDYEQLVECVT